MGFLGKSVLVSLLALWCFTSSVFTEDHATQTPFQPPAPAPYHHGTLPPHPHHPTKKPPTKPPPPTKSPVKPPVSPPAKPPVKPPTKPPGSPPAKPPVKPPTKPPTKSPVKPPTKPPVKPPTMPPTKPPVSPPAKPPVMPPVYPPPPKFNQTLVAVQGTVFCKSCRYAPIDTLTPIQGATVSLICIRGFNIIVETTTNENGYFLLLAPKTVTNFDITGCRSYLVKSKDYKCSKISKLNGGDVGAVLEPEKSKLVIINKLKYTIFNVGPFAFNPACPQMTMI